MQFVREANDALNIIRAYGDDGIQIGTDWYQAPLIVTPERLITDWDAPPAAGLSPATMETVAVLDPALIVLGTGATLVFPDPAITRELGARGIGLEVMDTAAACRTYNVLAHEGRRVAAALLTD